MPQLGYSKLPKREEEICVRLREIRNGMKWKQSDFALEFGITRERLASYEYARAPLRYDFGSKVCARFGVSQRWLATGKKPQSPNFKISQALEKAIPARKLFSEVYDSLLNSLIKNVEQSQENEFEWMKKYSKALPPELKTLPIGVSAEQHRLNFTLYKIMFRVSEMLTILPDKHWQEFCEGLSDHCESIFGKYMNEINDHNMPEKRDARKHHEESHARELVSMAFSKKN